MQSPSASHSCQHLVLFEFSFCQFGGCVNLAYRVGTIMLPFPCASITLSPCFLSLKKYFLTYLAALGLVPAAEMVLVLGSISHCGAQAQ